MKKISKYFKKIIISISKFFLLFISILFVLAFIYKWVPIPLTPLMVIRSFQNIDNDKFVTKYDWINEKKISKNIIKAAIASEDDRFYEHHGFDFKAIEKAYYHNKKNSKKVRGASTISQQTAKNIFLWPARDWFRKFFEVYVTILIESLWSKQRILEVYLNVIEFGPGIYGVESASKHFFQKTASQLSASEASLLIAVLPRPLKYNVSKPTSYVLKRQNSILRRISRTQLSAQSVQPSAAEVLQKKAENDPIINQVDDLIDKEILNAEDPEDNN